MSAGPGGGEEPSAHYQANNYDRVAHIYDATRNFPTATGAVIGDGLAALLKERGVERLLEVGIGTGRVAVLLAERGITVTGIDISAGMMRQLRAKRSDVNLVLAEASFAPFREGAFDAALFAHVLHLVPDPMGMIRAAAGCVRRGGVLVHCRNRLGDFRTRGSGARLAEITREESGGTGRHGNRNWEVDQLFVEATGALGATTGDFDLASWEELTTARIEIEKMRSRANSNSWALSDGELARVIERYAPEAEAIYGGLDTPDYAPLTFTATIASLPG